MERVDVINLLASFDDGIKRKVYQEKEIEMKGIILEILANVLKFGGERRPELLNALFRNSRFNILGLIISLSEKILMKKVSKKF